MTAIVSTELVEIEYHDDDYAYSLVKWEDTRDSKITYRIEFHDIYWAGDYSESWDVTDELLDHFGAILPLEYKEEDKAWLLELANSLTHTL